MQQAAGQIPGGQWAVQGGDVENAIQEGNGDFVVAARCNSPTEAHQICANLRAGGVQAWVADANLAQSHSIWTTALGGVRVMVSATDLVDAKQILDAWQTGELALADTDPVPVPETVPPLTEPVRSVDAAAWWSVFFTPMFAALVHLGNARVLNQPGMVRQSLVSTALMAVVTVSGFAVLPDNGPHWLMPWRASLILIPFTLLWYFALGLKQSRFVVSRYGVHYKRRSICPAVALAVLAFGALGLLLEVLT